MKSGEVFDYENEKLKNTIAIINQKIAKLKDNFDKEIHTIIGFKEGQRGTQFNRQSMMSLYATQVNDLKFILNNPYFCRFDFTPEGESEADKIYMGKKNITDCNSNTIIYDWRSSLCSMYYDYNIGDAEYKLNDEIIKGNISLKRQLIIKDGILEDVEEQDTLTNDNMLMLYLSEHADTRLKTIIATIQREQNKIIRSPLNDNYIIQGVAGSGKTTVALHRIAYLLYNEAKITDESEFMIIGPNKYFLNYISSLLPELDINNVSQNTFEQLALSNLNCKYKIESKNTTLQKVLNREIDQEIIKYKNSLQFMKLVEDFVNDYIKLHLQQDIVYEGVILSSKDSSSRIYSSNNYSNNSFSEKINKYIKLISSSVKDHQEELCHQAWVVHRNEITSLPINDPKRAELLNNVDRIQKEIKNGCKNFLKDYFKFIKVNPLNLYQSFIENIELYQEKIPVNVNLLKQYTLNKLNNKEVGSDDLAPILLINQLIHGTKTNDHYTHLVIDEAQDLSLPQYYMLKSMFPKAKLDIYGDINQSIYDYQSISNWKDLNELIFDNKASMLELNKSYRTTTQISDSSKLVLNELQSSIEAECIARSGEDVTVCCVDDKFIIDNIIKQISTTLEKGFATIAIICKDDKETDKLYNLLKKTKLKINRISEKNTNYVGGICIMPSYLSKGLEFDSVIISNANDEYYTDSSIDLKLLYVSLTRAMHELYINYNGEITKSLKSLTRLDENKVYQKK